ncbi:MAG: DUF72 domain-containing protein [Acidobacteriota bacterium]
MGAYLMGRILLGTSSWSAPGWKGTFYPDGMADAEHLAFYAGRYATVEADVTYYRIPSAAMVQGWARKTPEEFILSAKFPRSITHAGSGPRPDPTRLLLPEVIGEDVERFLSVMGLLGPRLGPLVLQFPYFNRQIFSGPQPFLDRLDRFFESLPDGFRFAVEVRNPAWLDEPLLAVLKRRGAALVLLDLHYLPHPDGLMDKMDLVTADFSLVRLIGHRKEVEEKTTRFDRIVLDRSPRLARWAALLKSLQPRAEPILVYANNHYAGHAPATIDQLAVLMEKE